MQTDGYQHFTLQLGSRIQEIRHERGLLQEDVAATLGMTRVAVGYIEQGRRSPKLSTLYELACLYNVDIRDFFAFLDSDKAPIE